jgi:DeoR/GlpR family transcriptional regulator of sugar metabolism
MTYTERDERIMEILRLKGGATVVELSEQLSIGRTTIRRDLRRLASDGRILRTHGAAALPGQGGQDTGDLEALEEKRQIAVAATALVQDGQTIAISSGTTTLEFARRLVGRSALKIVTNALSVVQVLLDQEGIELVVLGGVVRPRVHSLLGHLTELALNEVRFETFYMGIDAIGPDGSLMNAYMPEIMMDRAFRRVARSAVVLADARKFDRVAPAHMFDLVAGDTVVTDSRVRDQSVQALEERGVRVIVARGPS